MMRVLMTALALMAASGAAGAQEFRHRGWVGAKLASDADGGCAMGLDVRRGAGLVIYANAKNALKIGVGDPGWRLAPAKEALGAVVFDDGPPLVLKGAAVSPTTVLFEPLDLGGSGALERLIETARTVRLTYAGSYLRARLAGSSRAIRLLRDCASAEARPETARGPGAAASPARSVDFAFLRQGMDAGEANTRLLEAGWQAEPAPEAAAEDPALAFLRERGVAARDCAGAPALCTALYADAYGNRLRLVATAGGDPTVRSWRLNPPDDAPEGEGDAGPDDEAPAEAAPPTAAR